MADLSYSASVQPEALPGRAAPRFPDEASPQDYGGAIGQGLEAAGAAANADYRQRQAVASHAMQLAQAQAQQTQLANAHNQLQSLSLSLTHDPETGAFTKQGQNAFGLNQQYLPQWDEKAAAIIQAIPDAQARAAAQSAAGQMRNQLSEQLDSHELQQHNAFADQTDLASVRIAQQAGPANYNHPDILASNHDTIGVSLANMANRKGWSQDELDQARQEAYSKFHTDVIDRMAADGKFAMAEHYLDANKGDMDANTAWSAGRMIEAAVKQKQNENRQMYADQFSDSLQAAQMGLKNPITISKAGMQVLYPQDWQRRWDGLQSIAQAGVQAQAFNRMTPDAIIAARDAAKPTEGGPEVAYQISRYQVLAQAAEKSINARTADPAQFAIDNGSWAKLDFSSAENAMAGIAQRARTQAEVSDQQGVSTPLLTKPEAKAFTAWLDKQPPAAAVQTLQRLRQATPDDASYASLLKTVAPASPITALAGATLDRPPEQDAPTWYTPDRFAAAPRLGERMLEGQDILRDKPEKGINSKFPMPKDTDLDNAFHAAIGGVSSDLFRGRPELQQAIYAAYKAVYAADSSRQGKSNGVLDSGIASQAAQDVVGRLTSYGHSSVVVPNGMDPTRFEGVMNAATQASLKAAGYDDSDIKALRGYGVRELGDSLGTGRYVIINGAGDPLTSKDHERPVVIDLNQQFRGWNPVKEAPPPDTFSQMGAAAAAASAGSAP